MSHKLTENFSIFKTFVFFLQSKKLLNNSFVKNTKNLFKNLIKFFSLYEFKAIDRFLCLNLFFQTFSSIKSIY